LYQHSTQGTNEDTTFFYSNHRHLQDRRPKQSQYMKAIGTNLSTMSELRNHISGLSDLTSMNSMERVSHQTTNEYLNHQMKNQQHRGHSQKTPAMTMNQCSVTHQQLSENLCRLQHQQLATHTMEEDPESYHHQTHTALASLLLARNNDRPQQIWQLRLLQLQQLWLLSNQNQD
jgi:hypothetical protein